MDPTAFDALTRSLRATGSRRRLLRRLVASLPLVGALAVVGKEAGTAERPLERLQRRTPQRNRKQRNKRRSNNDNNDNRKGKRKDQNKVGTQNCPDGRINCWTWDNSVPGGQCLTLVHQFPTGTCYHFPVCCPCDHRDQAYWTDYCNQNVFECRHNELGCLAELRVGDLDITTCFGCPGGLE